MEIKSGKKSKLGNGHVYRFVFVNLKLSHEKQVCLKTMINETGKWKKLWNFET